MNFKKVELRLFTIEEFIKKVIVNQAEYVELMTSSNGTSYEIRVSEGKFAEIEYQKMMQLKIKFLPKFDPFYDALTAELTETGNLQLDFIKKHLENLHSTYTSNDFYAPLTGIIQSSGFGKSKICLDLLKTCPGIYCVFRKRTSSGIPKVADWMNSLDFYVLDAKSDELPSTREFGRSFANHCTPGRFLIGLSSILESYKKFLEERINTGSSIDSAIKEVGSSFADEPNSEKFDRIIFKFDGCNTINMTFEVVLKRIASSLSSIRSLTKRQRGDCPFLLILDSLESFNHKEIPSRISGFDIVRRALHCLDSDEKFFALSISTDIDALNFTPIANEIPWEYRAKQYNLPPFILSGNWDIFSSIVNYEDIQLNSNSLMNFTMLNVLISLGRPLWSSCRLNDVMSLAVAKLRNGPSNSYGIGMALLLTRVNSLKINVHHVLAKTLVASYMAIVTYLSTDTTDMKITYSSDPVLAMAARFLLTCHGSRTHSLQILREMLFQGAIEKDGILAAMFQHLILFSIDDAGIENGYCENPEIPEFPLNVQEKLTKCQTFLLESQLSRTAMITEPSTEKTWLLGYRQMHYKISNLGLTLSKILNDRKFDEIIKRTIKGRTRDALISTCHFTQLESVNKEDFIELSKNVGKTPAKFNVIDKSLLKVGVLRQCGYHMPPNYFGIDFIVPLLIKRDDQKNIDDIFSFVAIRSRTVNEDIVECAFKMSALFHLNRCPNKKHAKIVDCEKNECRARMEMYDIMTILEDQVVILLTAKSANSRSKRNRKFGTTVCLKDSNESERIIDEALVDFKEEIFEFVPDLNRESMEAISFPSYFEENEILPELRPNCILTRNLNEYFTLQKMIWSWSEEQIEDFLLKKAKTEGEEGSGEKTKKRKMALTCIAINDIQVFEHLLNANGIALIREIINFSTSNQFQNVEKLHKAVFQNSMLNGTFSPYYEMNPMLQKARGDNKTFPLLPNPLENYRIRYPSLETYVIGPIDKRALVINDTKFYKKSAKRLNRIDFDKYKMRMIRGEPESESESDSESD